MSPTTEISGCPGSVRSGPTLMRPARSCSAPHACVTTSATAAAATPAAQRTVPASYLVVAPEASRTCSPSWSTAVTIECMCSSTPSDDSAVDALPASFGAEGRQRRVPAVEQQDPGLAGVDPPELATQRVGGELPDLAGQLDPRRPRTDQRERQPALSLDRVARCLRHLEGAEQLPADEQGVGQRLHAGRVLGELVVAEVGLSDAGGHDQVVVGEVDACRLRGAPRARSGSSASTTVTSPAMQSTLPVPLHQVTQRDRDLTFGQDAGGDLVEQRLEEVVRGPIDDGHVDMGAA